ncbi:MAG: hypothetical protein EP343_09290 [Deltaproteobacteria bacterium]|nr:MAG: hypothetical protein EP343_09290 [Deltaproteobacteria bacterium]
MTHHPGLTYWKRLGQQVFGVASSLGGITGSTYVLVATMLQTSLGQAHWATTIAMLSLQGLVMGMGMKGLFLTLKHKNASIVVQPDLKIGSEGEWQPGFLVSLSI